MIEPGKKYSLILTKEDLLNLSLLYFFFINLPYMKYKLCCTLASVMFFLFIINASAQENTLGIFEDQTDVGNPHLKGKLVYEPRNQYYTIDGAGANIWAKRDEFHFVWRKISGDFILRSFVSFVGKGVEEHRKIGLMIRSSLDDDAAYADVAVHGNGLTSLQFRRSKGDTTQELKSNVFAPGTIELERKGNTYFMRVAQTGNVFTTNQLTDLNLGNNVYVGLFVCSHNASVSEEAIFNNVRIVVPPKAGYTPYKDYIGSMLEVEDISTLNSTIIFQHPKSIQAPNWMHDGKRLLYNGDGLLYTFDFRTNKPTVLNTGNATKNNNDHVISFDGKMLAISNTPNGESASNVYTVPITGGEPTRITKTGPSYLHGWSPDGKSLVFVGQRNGDYDIYKIPSEGGDEVQLTKSPGLDDGCEYSPDGKYIYFNSVRSGSMQIWRMQPDGTNPEQLTNDTLHNWFPHISPDGKWIVFISFDRNEVAANDHPFYKHVYIRKMPANGGNADVIAYLYGGQGTINTPSWSPDSKKIAYISNSDLLFDIFPK